MRNYATSGKAYHAPLQTLLAEIFGLASSGASPDVIAEEVGKAEKLWEQLRATAAERQRRQQINAQQNPNLWKSSLNNGYHGQVARWATNSALLVAATDASRRGRRIGWGYVVSDGRWGLRHIHYIGRDPTGPATVLVNELRAVYFLLNVVDVAARLHLLVDNAEAHRYLTQWQNGGRAMPRGYDLRPRSKAAEPTLVRLAYRVAQMTHLNVQNVRAHRGHPLNEAAHSLSVIARRANRSERGHDSPEQMEDMVGRFLAKWHQGRSKRT